MNEGRRMEERRGDFRAKRKGWWPSDERARVKKNKGRAPRGLTKCVSNIGIRKN